MKIKSFECPKSIRNYENKILGTSDTWSTSHLSQQTSEPTYYIVDCRIFVCTYSSSRLQAACSRCGTSTAPSVLEAPTRIGHRRARAADTLLQTNHASLTAQCAARRRRRLQPLAGSGTARARRILRCSRTTRLTARWAAAAYNR